MESLPQLSIVKGPTRSLNPTRINDILQKNLQQNATKTALIFEKNDQIHKHTYEELDLISTKYAKIILEIIRTKNLEKNPDGDFIVAVNLEPSDDLIIILLAIWKAGIAYLPLDHTFPQARIDHILAESQPVMVIFDDNKHTYPDTEAISLDNLKKYSQQTDWKPIKDHSPNDIAIVLYTSGSTGVPKGVRIPHKAIQNRLQWQFKTFPYSQTEKTCVFKTALTFVDSVSEIWGPLISGLGLLVIGKDLTKDPEKLIHNLDKYEVERLVLVPSLLRSLLLYLNMKVKKCLGHLKLWVCSGEILSQSLAGEFYRYFPENEYRLCNFYGSTEIMGDVTYHTITGLGQLKSQDKVPIGLPIDNTVIYLFCGDLRPVKAGTIGELYVAGLNLASGYVRGRDPEKFIANPLGIDPIFSKLYKTGDFARLDENGVILYEGRTDSQVKIRGNRVDLSEIEKVLNNLPSVDKGIVLCYKPGEINQILLAFVTTSVLISENQLENLLKNQLTSYMVPQVVLIENIPLLVNGKVDRQALLRMYEKNTNNNNDDSYQADIDYTGVPLDRMKAAKILFETIAAVLGRSVRSAISIKANFYAIGGNSLNSILTITKLNDSGYYINIGGFIGAIDLGEILEQMTEGTTNKINTEPMPYKTESLYPDHKKAVLQIITNSFYQKADLEQWLMPYISESDYTELMEKLWQPLIEKNLSFVTKSQTNEIVGVALNFDAYDEPEVEITSKLTIIFDFLEAIEGPIRDAKLPKGKGKILHSFMMGTHQSLTPKENVIVMQFMEEQVLKLAKSKEFHGIFTTNTSPLTQQLGGDIYNYQTMLDYQVNQYVAKDGTKPFGLAPDSQRAIVHWKSIL